MRPEPADSNFARRVHDSFARQGLMATLGATLSRVEPGEVEIEMPNPGAGDRLIARAKVVRAGRTLSICQAEVSAVNRDEERVVAIMTATIMNVKNSPGVEG